MSYIIANRIKTPDGTILHSKTGHDYVHHNDANGDYYFTDGGNQYLRRSVNAIPATALDVTTESPFRVQREAFVWGTYGKTGKDPLKWVKLSALTDDHIKAILETQKHIPEWMRIGLFQQELNYRDFHDNHINECSEAD